MRSIFLRYAPVKVFAEFVPETLRSGSTGPMMRPIKPPNANQIPMTADTYWLYLSACWL